MSVIEIKHNNSYPEIEYKFGSNRYATHHHIHCQWSLSYVIHGATTASIGPETISLSAGKFVAIPGFIPHVCKPHSGSQFSFAVLYLPQLFLSRKEEVSHTFRTGSCSVQSFRRIVETFLTVATDGEIHAAANSLFSLLDATGEKVSDRGITTYSVPPDPAFNNTEPERQSRFQIYYHSHKRYGIGTKRIDTIRRIEKAKKLIKQGLSLSAIALDCDFYDQSHFTKAFKQHTGMSPRQYRN